MAIMEAAEKIGYRHQKRNAQNQFQQLQAKAGLRKGFAADDYARRARDINVDYKRTRYQMPTKFNERGMLRSGVFERAKRELAAERARQVSDAVAAQSRAYQTADLDVSQGRTNMVNLLQQIDAMEEARLADLAAKVEGIRI